MAPPERSAVRRLLVLGLTAAAVAAAVSVALDRGARRARDAETARGWCRVLALVAGGPQAGGAPQGGPSLDPLLSAVVRTQPGVSFVRVEAGDGRVLGQAGDAARALAWEDRTLGLERGAVRVRVGYRPGSQPLVLAVRAGLWALLAAGFGGAGAAVVAWTLRGRGRT